VDGVGAVGVVVENDTLPLNVFVPFSNATFVLSAPSAIDLFGRVIVPEETVSPPLAVNKEENVFAPPTVCVDVKST
jgi:hypothetical protein